MRRTEDEVLEIEVHKAAVLQYKKDMTALRKDIEKEVCAECQRKCICNVFDKCVTDIVYSI